MKKIFTLLSIIALSAFTVKAQSFALYKVNQTGTAITGTVNTNDVMSFTTTANSQEKIRLRITNLSSTNTHTYNVIRTILFNNPPLVVSGASVSPQTYMCVGTTCYDNSVATQTLVADMTVLPPSSNSDVEGMPFVIYLEEASSLGQYDVRYKVFNQVTAGDTITFTMRYNSYLSVSENKSVIESASDVFPNPANTNAFVNVTLKNEGAVKVQIYNSLGALVYSGNEQKFAPGKHKVNFDCGSLNSGIYFVTLNAGESKITKRMVINK